LNTKIFKLLSGIGLQCLSSILIDCVRGLEKVSEMLTNYYKVTITETGRNTLKEQPHIFNAITEDFETLELAKKYLVERYGKIPKLTPNNTIYQNSKDGKAQEIGFIKSYWNKDISHNSSSWYQTDWVTVTKVTENWIIVKF